MEEKKSLLEKLKLVDHLTTEIPLDQKVFVERLKAKVEEGETSIMFSAFESFRPSKSEYKGTVTADSFKIRRKRKLFDSNLNTAHAEGTFRQQEDKVIIESTIRSLNGFFMIAFVVFVSLFYIVAIVSMLLSNAKDSIGLFAFPFIIFHAAFMFGIPYFAMRRGVARMKYDLERDLYYLTK